MLRETVTLLASALHLMETVRGYREDLEAGLSPASIDRRFERDKDLVRDLGIPIEAIHPPDGDDDNKLTVYRIPKTDYDLPDDWELGSQDIRLLNTAAAVWREGSLSAEARVTHTKLASLGIQMDEPLIGFLPVITARDPALDALRRAVDRIEDRPDHPRNYALRHRIFDVRTLHRVAVWGQETEKLSMAGSNIIYAERGGAGGTQKREVRGGAQTHPGFQGPSNTRTN